MLRLCSSILVLAAAALLWPAQASAHAILLDSEPAARATVPPGPADIKLRFNSRVDHARSRMALRANGAEAALPIDPASAADSLAAATTLTPGDYVVRWQVLAVDGHITRGDVPFTVRAR
jgi:methionine-rich copper-binding protein CopC